MDIRNEFLNKYYRENGDDEYIDILYTTGRHVCSSDYLYCVKLYPRCGDFYVGKSEIRCQYLEQYYTEISKEEFLAEYNNLDKRVRKECGDI